MGRRVLENFSQAQAKLIDRTDDWLWCHVLGSFDMYAMDGDASITPHLVQEGFWESWITQWVINNVELGSNFIDIGANAGYYSFVTHHLGAYVTAFEANPKFVEMMRATIERNEWGGIRVYDTALSDKIGTATLHVPQYLQGSSSFNPIDDKYRPFDIDVPTQTLDNFFGHANLNSKYTIKMDVEGAEEMVWDGMTKWLAYVKPTILLEYTPGAYSDDFIDKLKSYAPLCWINGDAESEPVTRQWIESRNDWVMLVLKP